MAVAQEPQAGELLDDGRAPLLTRIMWRLVVFFAAVLLLAAVTLASVAMLSPDAWTGACKRTQLVRPEGCATVSLPS